MTDQFTVKSTTKVFNGLLTRFSHLSKETKTIMTCSVYIPQGVTSAPGLLYLSGLTCTDENVCQKSGIFQSLSEYKVCIVPDVK